MRATFVSPRGPHYRRPGGPWDVGALDLSRDPEVATLAGGLREAGVRRGDVVAWQLPNRDEAARLYHACWRLGAVAAPLHHAWGGAEVDHAMKVLSPRVVFGPDDPLPSGEAMKQSMARPADLALVMFTSGSTGLPKAVLHTHRSLRYKARLMARVHGLKHDDAVLMPAPLAHVSGLLNGVLVPAAAGMAVVLMERWDPEQALMLIERERITFMVGPPTFFVALMDAPGFSAKRVASLRLVSSGGAGVSPEFVAQASEELGCVVKRTYGSTEAPTMTTSYAGDPPERARTTDGRPVGEAEVRIVDGEVQVRGPEMFAGYLDPAQTRLAIARGGWYRTGDRGELDDGWLRITGRLADVVIRGGENIAVAEIEAAVAAHPFVRQVAVVGYPDDLMGERVGAVVATAGGIFDLETCRSWFLERGLARFKTPERVVTVDAIPMAATGKPDRAALRVLLEAAAQ